MTDKTELQEDIETIDRYVNFYHDGWHRQSPFDVLPVFPPNAQPGEQVTIDFMPLVLAWARVKEALKHD